MPKIAVVGDAMLDVEIRGEWDGVCPENRAVNLFRGQEMALHPGGAANVAAMLASDPNVEVDLLTIGSSGNQWAAGTNWIASTIENLLPPGVRTLWFGGGTPPLKVRGISGGRVVSRIDNEVPIERTERTMVLRTLAEVVGEYDGVIFSDYRKGTISMVDEPDIQDIIRNSRVSVVDSKRPDHRLWHGATALCPNHHEAVNIFGVDDPVIIQRACNTEAVYITRGDHPVLLSYVGETVEIPVRAVRSPYVVGAGDAFCVGLLLSLIEGRGYIDAGRRAVSLCEGYVSRGDRVIGRRSDPPRRVHP